GDSTDRRQARVRVDSDADPGPRHRRRGLHQESGLDEDPGSTAADHRRLSSHGVAGLQGNVVQVSESQQPVTEVDTGGSEGEKGNGGAIPMVPQRPSVPVVELEQQTAGCLFECPSGGWTQRNQQRSGGSSGQEDEGAAVHGGNVLCRRSFVYAI